MNSNKFNVMHDVADHPLSPTKQTPRNIFSKKDE